MKEAIRKYALSLGIDDVGFAAVVDYNSPRSPKLETIFPDTRSIVVLAYKELSACAGPDLDTAMSSRQDLISFARSSNYQVARFLERQYRAKAYTVPISVPFAMVKETGGAVAQVSLRHAAKASGLGVFGRHNLIIHPRFGTRVNFSAVLTDLEISSDPPLTDELCNDCNLCVECCPAGALDEEGKTSVNKCFGTCQPYGMGGNIKFWTKVLAAPPDEQKRMMSSVEYWRLYQSILVGNQYYCFKCEEICPIGTDM